MITQLERPSREKAASESAGESAVAPASKGALLRALNDLRRAEEFGEIPKREADFLTRYLITLFTLHQFRVAADKQAKHLFERYSAVFGEDFGD